LPSASCGNWSMRPATARCDVREMGGSPESAHRPGDVMSRAGRCPDLNSLALLGARRRPAVGDAVGCNYELSRRRRSAGWAPATPAGRRPRTGGRRLFPARSLVTERALAAPMKHPLVSYRSRAGRESARRPEAEDGRGGPRRDSRRRAFPAWLPVTESATGPRRDSRRRAFPAWLPVTESATGPRRDSRRRAFPAWLPVTESATGPRRDSRRRALPRGFP
jgi:hypothetical protein